MPRIEAPARNEQLFRQRHSFAHVLAQAVIRLHPDVRLGFGPPVGDGFYYDFLLPPGLSLGEADLPAIEAEMQRILAEKQVFEVESLPAEAAFSRLRDEPLKLEYAHELVARQRQDAPDSAEPVLDFWRNGPFVDLCKGPHVADTGELPIDGFRLYSVAGAYWRGDEQKPMLSRIQGWAYATRQALEERAAAVELARQRDHRRLGRQLGLFAFDDLVGKGLPLWLPKGAALRRCLEDLAHEMEHRAGYQPVSTPALAQARLFEASGHLPLYADAMFPPMELRDGEAGAGCSHAEDGSERLYLRPMNCPHHHRVFAAEKRSYRDLPLRLTEYGNVYRYERSGILQGLARVRSMTMNDAHLYVTPEQLHGELAAVIELHRHYYSLFDFEDYHLRLSLWNPADRQRKAKYVDDPEAWEWSQGVLGDVLDSLGLDYTVGVGEAAFYGPKIDFQFRSVIEREYTVSTCQLDFAQPGRLELRYTDRDGQEKTPLCIHRAPLSTHERFVAFLIEHYGGAFPVWLAPVQVRLLPIADRHAEAARQLERRLRHELVRVELDSADASLGKRIRRATVEKIPIVLVLGDREVESGNVSVRRYGSRRQDALGTEIFVEQLLREIRERRASHDPARPEGGDGS